MIQINSIYHDIQLSFGTSDVKRTTIKQNSEDTHVLRIKLYDKQNNEITIDSNWNINISAIKGDKTHILNTNNISIKDNTIHVTMTKQMLSASGTEHCELIIQDRDQTLFSDTFLIYVEPNVQDGSFIESSNECDSIIDTLQHVEEKKDMVDQLTSEIEETKVDIGKTYDELKIAVEETNGLIQENQIIKSNEAERQNNEGIRQSQEADRQTNTATAIANAEAATERANNATDDLQNKLDSHHFVLTEDKDIAGGVPSLDVNAKVPINELYEATTTSKGITQLTDSVTSDSTTTAATPNSVKSVKDSLNSEITRAKSAEKANADAISTETSRATTKENEITNNLSVLETNLGDLKKEEVDNKIESEVATDFSQADTPQFQQTIDDVFEEVNELKGDLGDTQNGNLIFELKENTYIDKGVEKPYQDWSSTDYIDLTGLKVIDYIVNDTSDLNTGYWSAFYDATKTFIRRINITSGGKIDVDSNAKFVRFSSGTKSIKSLKIKNRFDFQYDFVESEKPYIQQIKNLPVITIPAYYVSHLRDKEATIRGLASKCAKGDSFVFITDTHHSTDYAINGNRASAHDNTNNSIDLIRHIMKNTGTRFIVFGGDCVNTSNGIDEMTHSIASYISRYEETKNNLVYCVGNHEFFSDYPNHTNIPTLETLYGCTAKSNESNYIGADGSFSYFFDNIAQKIRYFVIGSNKDTVVSNETTNWVLEEFQNIPNGYKVICIGHAFLSDDLTAFRGRFKVISEALDALKSKSVYNYVYTQYTTYTYDYTGTNVEPICMITGHTHIDGSISTQGGIPCICTTTDSFYQNHERVNGAVTNVPREKDTINEQAFDVFTIDTVNKKIYTTRIGYGADREFSY